MAQFLATSPPKHEGAVRFPFVNKANFKFNLNLNGLC